jgi:hypothetical protein
MSRRGILTNVPLGVALPFGIGSLSPSDARAEAWFTDSYAARSIQTMQWPTALAEDSVVPVGATCRMPAVGFGMYNTDAKSAFQAVTEALEAGVRSIDTAAAYGNEKEVGMGWKASGLARSDLTLSSKLSNIDLRDGNVKQAVERSLRLLQTDYLDAYYIHSPLASPAQREKAWKEMHVLQSQGLIRACGLSNFGVEKIKLLTDNTRLPPPALIQVYIYVYVYMYVRTYVRMYVRIIYVCVYVCVCLFVCVHACMYVCMYIYHKRQYIRPTRPATSCSLQQ